MIVVIFMDDMMYGLIRNENDDVMIAATGGGR